MKSQICLYFYNMRLDKYITIWITCSKYSVVNPTGPDFTGKNSVSSPVDVRLGHMTGFAHWCISRRFMRHSLDLSWFFLPALRLREELCFHLVLKWTKHEVGLKQAGNLLASANVPSVRGQKCHLESCSDWLKSQVCATRVKRTRLWKRNQPLGRAVIVGCWWLRCKLQRIKLSALAFLVAFVFQTGKFLLKSDKCHIPTYRIIKE